MQKAKPRLVLLAGLIGMSFSAILVRFSSAPSLVSATYRMVWASLIITPVILIRHRDELKRLSRRDLILCCSSGILLALHFAAWFESLKLTSITNSTVLVCTDVIFASIGYALFLKGKIPKGGILSIAVTFAGSVVIALGNKTASAGSIKGDLLALAGAVFVAGYILIGRVQRAHLTTNMYTWLVYSSSAITLLCLSFATSTPLTGWGKEEVFIGFLLGLVCTILGHSLVSWSLKYLSPAYISATKLCEPVFASILAIIFFAEVPSFIQITGALVIITGVCMFSNAERKSQISISSPPGKN